MYISERSRAFWTLPYTFNNATYTCISYGITIPQQRQKQSELKLVTADQQMRNVTLVK